MKITAAIVIGIILGFVGSKILFVGSALSLIPWAVAGLVIGYLSVSRREAAIGGSLYGFALAFSFMAFGYDGAASLISRLPFFAVLGVIGAVCGLVPALIGRLVRAATNTANN
jgi:hypothetical protein